MEATYETLVETARIKSKGGFAAVCEVVTYRTGKSRLSVFAGKDRIASRQRGSEFVGVVAQFKDGRPLEVTRQTPAPAVELAEGELPF